MLISREKISSIVKEWLSFLLFAIILFVCRSAIADWNRIPSSSMEPTVYIGDLVLVNKLAYDLKIPFSTMHLKKWSDPKRGDIVVFYKPQDNQRLIKRVIGTPGDIIEMRNNVLIINGVSTKYKVSYKSLPYKLPESEHSKAIIATEYLESKQHSVMSLPTQPAPRTFGPIEVPQEKFLMLGDNRDISGDSRYFGLVPRGNIVGRAERVLVSWDKEDYYKPRFNRFLQKLI